ncbi:unnamed protein product [Orchesella dallaii]|uniref:Transcription initiation factor TFIID subunit 12 n=1 Tax=Orchesella dallaii TaxID=48710 RepID=A0ABP1RDG6_9HEXA
MSDNGNIITKWTPTYTNLPPPPPVSEPRTSSSTTKKKKSFQSRTGGGVVRSKKGVVSSRRPKPRIVIVRGGDVTSPGPGGSSASPPIFNFESDWSPSWFPNRVVPTAATSTSVANSPEADTGDGSKWTKKSDQNFAISTGSPATQTRMRKKGGGGRLTAPPASKRTYPDLEIIRNPQYLQVSRNVASTSTSGLAPPKVHTTFLAPVVSQTKGKNKIIQPGKLQQMLKAVDPTAELERDAELALDKYADTFLSQLLEGACQLANHRGSDKVEIGDLATYLGRHKNMKVSVGPDGETRVKPIGNKLQLNAHCQRWGLMNGSIKKY